MGTLLAVAAAVPLWLLGAIFFDAVHCALHAMLRSRWPRLRALAWPHSVHHAWIDRNLEVHPELRWRNVFCHIVPEYLTQVAFTVALAVFLPALTTASLLALQTVVFLGILRAGGLDRNHRPVDFLDAYRPGLHTPPAYHALHHVHPDAYYSAYTKVVDAVVGGGAALRGRRFAFAGSGSPFERALRREIGRRGAAGIADVDPRDETALAALDVLVLCDARQSPVPAVEAFVRATRTRRLPPEVWAVHAEPVDPTARHYHRDVRVSYRTIVLRGGVPHGATEAARAARAAVFWIRHGCHLVPTGISLRALADWWRFRRTAPERPAAAPLVRRRADLAARP